MQQDKKERSRNKGKKYSDEELHDLGIYRDNTEEKDKEQEEDRSD